MQEYKTYTNSQLAVEYHSSDDPTKNKLADEIISRFLELFGIDIDDNYEQVRTPEPEKKTTNKIQIIGAVPENLLDLKSVIEVPSFDLIEKQEIEITTEEYDSILSNDFTLEFWEKYKNYNEWEKDLMFCMPEMSILVNKYTHSLLDRKGIIDRDTAITFLAEQSEVDSSILFSQSVNLTRINYKTGQTKNVRVKLNGAYYLLNNEIIAQAIII